MSFKLTGDDRDWIEYRIKCFIQEHKEAEHKPPPKQRECCICKTPLHNVHASENQKIYCPACVDHYFYFKNQEAPTFKKINIETNGIMDQAKALMKQYGLPAGSKLEPAAYEGLYSITEVFIILAAFEWQQYADGLDAVGNLHQKWQASHTAKAFAALAHEIYLKRYPAKEA